MILTCSLIYSTYTFQHFQTIICIALACVLDLNAIRFSCVPPVCPHPKKHVVWWYHKHGIPLMATFLIVATLYSVIVCDNIWNLSFQQCSLNSIRNKWSIIIRIRIRMEFLMWRFFLFLCLFLFILLLLVSQVVQVSILSDLSELSFLFLFFGLVSELS